MKGTLHTPHAIPPGRKTWTSKTGGSRCLDSPDCCHKGCSGCCGGGGGVVLGRHGANKNETVSRRERPALTKSQTRRRMGGILAPSDEGGVQTPSTVGVARDFSGAPHLRIPLCTYLTQQSTLRTLGSQARHTIPRASRIPHVCSRDNG